MRRFQSRFVLIVASLLLFAAQNLLSAETIDPQKATPSSDGDTLWYDGKLIGVEGRAWSDTQSFYDRLPARAEGKVPKRVWELSHHSAGLCLRFSTDAATLQVRWTLASDELAMLHMPATGVSGVDLYAKQDGQWRFVGNGRPKGVSNTAKFTVPRNAEILLYLPLYNGVKSVEIGIPKDRALSTPDAAAIQQRKTIVFYGTSITQGGCASRPGMAFTAIVGRRLDAAVVNLGFSGSGKMEPEMADLLAGLDPSLFVLDCVGNMTVKEVSERIEPFVKKLREAHADTPILLTDDSAYRTASPTEKGRAIRAAYEGLTSQGVKNFHFLPKEGTLGDDGEATVDGIHPSDLGMMREADAFTQAIRPLLETAVRKLP
jgi:hypothetical protein